MKNNIILGKKDIFSIEAELRQVQEYIFINYCLWGKGKMIGDNTVTSLLSSNVSVGIRPMFFNSKISFLIFYLIDLDIK